MSPQRDFVPVLVRPRVRGPARGFVLVVALLMLAVIGLASAAIMRNAVGSEQVANSNRLQTQANQYAQLGLRFCQSQLALPPQSRTVALLPAIDPPAWTALRNWTSSGARGAHTLAAGEIGGAVVPRVAPQCLMEATSSPGAYTVTARGFSADFKADVATGATRSGSAVWLQATVYADSAAGAALIVRQRTWQQLLTPPF